MSSLKPATRWAPIAPMPDDPSRCRWCSGTLTALRDGESRTYCQNGCASNLTAPYVGHCPECSREFETGKQGATLCHSCDQAEAKQFIEAFAEHGQPTYRFEEFKRGGYR